MRSVLIFEGPGFSDSYEAASLFKDRGWNPIVKSLNLGGNRLDYSKEIEEVDLIFLKAPWTATPEEKLYASVIAESLEPTFKAAQKKVLSGKLRIWGIGRGALVLMSSSVLWPQQKPIRATWMRALSESEPWVRIFWQNDDANLKTRGGIRLISVESRVGSEMGISESSFGNVDGSNVFSTDEASTVGSGDFEQPMGLVQGRAFPIIDEQNSWKLKLWQKVGDQGVGWKTGDNKIFLSLVDPLAYTDRTQLEGFGYNDLMRVPSRVQVLEYFLTEG